MPDFKPGGSMLPYSSKFLSFDLAALNPITIEVEVKTVFGKDLIYPVNPEAVLLANIAGTKTLSLDNVAAAIALGLNVKEVNPNKLNLDNR